MIKFGASTFNAASSFTKTGGNAPLFDEGSGSFTKNSNAVNNYSDGGNTFNDLVYIENANSDGNLHYPFQFQMYLMMSLPKTIQFNSNILIGLISGLKPK